VVMIYKAKASAGRSFSENMEDV